MSTFYDPKAALFCCTYKQGLRMYSRYGLSVFFWRKSIMYHITTHELLIKWLERPLYTAWRWSLRCTEPKALWDARHPTKPASEERNPVFRRREAENGQAQTQLSGTTYLFVRKTLTGLTHPEKVDEKMVWPQKDSVGEFKNQAPFEREFTEWRA